MGLGIAFSFVASVCFGLSNLLEKAAVDRMADISVRRFGQTIKALFGSPIWIAGFLTGALAVLLMVCGYSLAPLPVAQSIFATGTIVVIIGSRVHLGEEIHGIEYGGLALVVIAIVFISVSLAGTTTTGTGGSPSLALAVSGGTAVVAALAFVSLRKWSKEPALFFGVASGFIYGIASLQAKGAAVVLERQGILEGTVHMFGEPYPYVFVVASLLGLFVFQSGLQQSRIALMAPLNDIIASAYLVATGMLVFDEPLPSSLGLAVLRIVGFTLVLVATGILAGSRSPAMPRLRISTVEGKRSSALPVHRGAARDDRTSRGLNKE